MPGNLRVNIMVICMAIEWEINIYFYGEVILHVRGEQTNVNLGRTFSLQITLLDKLNNG